MAYIQKPNVDMEKGEKEVVLYSHVEPNFSDSPVSRMHLAMRL